MDKKREEFFKHIINDHFFGNGEDLDGWHWCGETKYKAFGDAQEVLVEISDADHDQYAYAYKSYEDLFRYGWSDEFDDWLMNYDYFDEEYWKITLSDIMRLKKYGYLSERFVRDLVKDLTSKEETTDEL